jgi:hypothetical protein
LSSISHSALPSTFASSRIQMSKSSGVSLWLLLKQQKTKPVSGSPAPARVGAPSAAPRLESLTW